MYILAVEGINKLGLAPDIFLNPNEMSIHSGSCTHGKSATFMG